MMSPIRNGVALVALSSAVAVLAAPTQLSARATTQASTDLCGDEDYIILDNSPWIVYNMMYNADETVGTQCTYYDSMSTASDGTAVVQWNSETEITYVESTNNVPKGYSFVGLTQNLENTISDIGSIPATYTWTRTNTTAFKGNVCFDFMTNDVSGDSTSTDSQELMLWLQYEGGQLPIGWADTPVATIDDLFGTSWDLYQGVNTGTGITVSSMLPTTQFDGTFEGDLKLWLEALVAQGLFTESTFVNVGNAGTEMFYGNAIMNATLGLQIDLGTSTTSNVEAASSVVSATPTLASTSSSSSFIAVASTSSSSSIIAVVATPSTSPISTIEPTPTSSNIAPLVTSLPTSIILSSSSSTSSAHTGILTPVAPIKSGSRIQAATSTSVPALATPWMPISPGSIISVGTSVSGPVASSTSAASGAEDDDDACAL